MKENKNLAGRMLKKNFCHALYNYANLHKLFELYTVDNYSLTKADCFPVPENNQYHDFWFNDHSILYPTFWGPVKVVKSQVVCTTIVFLIVDLIVSWFFSIFPWIFNDHSKSSSIPATFSFFPLLVLHNRNFLLILYSQRENLFIFGILRGYQLIVV